MDSLNTRAPAEREDDWSALEDELGAALGGLEAVCEHVGSDWPKNPQDALRAAAMLRGAACMARAGNAALLRLSAEVAALRADRDG
ncbi:MAG: hypothetical protein OXG72_13190 [Acidobacteria bacterium]|nr:hypothetical protein [Acidobacteriota bacterium]